MRRRLPVVLRIRSARAGVSIPILLVLLTAIAFISSTLVVGILVRRANHDANRNAAATIAGAIGRERALLSKATLVNAQWDEAANHVYGVWDLRWLRSFYGAATACAFVLDANGRTLFGHTPGNGRAKLETLIPASALRTLLDHVPRTEAEARRRKDAFVISTSFGGQPALIGIMPIVRESGPLTLDRLTFRLSVEVSMIDNQRLADWSKAYSLPDLHSNLRGRTGEPMSSTTLLDWAGRPLATITWRSLSPGSTAFVAILPLTLGCALLFLVVSGVLIDRVTRLSRQSEAKSVAAEAATSRQEEARLLAEAALAETREAKAESEAQAHARTQAEGEHRRELKTSARVIADQLQETVGALVEDLLASATELDRSADHSLRVIREQEAQVRTANDRSDRTTRATAAILETMKALAASVESIGKEASRSANKAIDGSRDSAAARSANESLVDSVAAIEQAADHIASLSRATNLLALNATIEAARAGDAGRGFAVVAQEVKAFSQQTAGTTKQIAECVNNIGRATASAVAISDSLGATLDTLAASARETINTAVQQEQDSASIRSMAVDIEENSDSARRALTAITDSFVATAAAANQTRSTSLEVRARTKALQEECARIVAMLRAA